MVLRHLYIHVPFCLRRCSYCDFAVQPTRRPAIDEWVEAITTELRLARTAEGWPESMRLDTLYVGGGTPSLMGEGTMGKLGDMLGRTGQLEVSVEWTAEANPESLTERLAADWRTAGVNRISLGVQSFEAAALRWMGRLHGADGARVAMRAARSAGFTDVNVDLIFGLPEHLGRDWSADLERALELEPEHVSLYGLTAESGAALGRWVTHGRAIMPADETYAAEYLTAVRVLTEAGFDHYEVSNFARPGHESRHNQAYWTGAPYLGLGPGAHSFHPPERFWNVRDWKRYRELLADGILPREGREQPDRAASTLEHLWLGLRTRSGARLPDRTRAVERTVRQWQTAGWAKADEETIRLTAEGWLRLDQLAIELDAAATA
ncbi:MAG TPA: radical SAM family heme chaperone HemW [Longimicrobiales bacterium]|nr:radical SAM family heme chaperone HemW [Longimicrobiales bacterium]